MAGRVSLQEVIQKGEVEVKSLSSFSLSSSGLTSHLSRPNLRMDSTCPMGLNDLQWSYYLGCSVTVNQSITVSTSIWLHDQLKRGGFHFPIWIQFETVLGFRGILFEKPFSAVLLWGSNKPPVCAKVSEDSLVQSGAASVRIKGFAIGRRLALIKKLGYSKAIALREACRQFSGHIEKQHLFVPEWRDSFN